jgi:hypothetical protein
MDRLNIWTKNSKLISTSIVAPHLLIGLNTYPWQNSYIITENMTPIMPLHSSSYSPELTHSCHRRLSQIFPEDLRRSHFLSQSCNAMYGHSIIWKEIWTLEDWWESLVVSKEFHLCPPLKKLTPKWYGPFTVKVVLSPITFKILFPPSWKSHSIFHASELSSYQETEVHGLNNTKPPPDITNGEEEYEIKAVLTHKGNIKGKCCFLVS